MLPPRAKWTPEERLADMDSLGVDVHVVSPYVGFYNYHLDAKIALATSRATNDEISSMTKTWPKRFAGLGTLFFLAYNGAFGGALAGFLTARGLSATFYSFVATHSAFELTAITCR